MSFLQYRRKALQVGWLYVYRIRRRIIRILEGVIPDLPVEMLGNDHTAIVVVAAKRAGQIGTGCIAFQCPLCGARRLGYTSQCKLTSC